MLTKQLATPALPDDFVEELLQIYPDDVRPMVVEGFEGLWRPARRLALEVLEAEDRNLPFAEAAQQPGFPLMAAVHFGLIDYLQLELSAKERDTVREVFLRALVRRSTVEQAERIAFEMAAGSTEWSAIVRFFIYQNLRLAAWIGTWRVPGAEALEVTGVLRRVDVETEERLRTRLQMDAMRDGEIRPLSVLAAEMWRLLRDTFHTAQDQLQDLSEPILEHMVDMMTATRIARSLDAADAVLLRNEIDAALGNDCLQLLPLVERHNLVLPSVDAAKQRWSRLRKRLEAGTVSGPRVPRLIDVLSELLSEMEGQR